VARRNLFRALRQTAQDRRELADLLYEQKVTVYVATLEDLAQSYGYELPDGGVELSEDVLTALREEADDNAQSQVETFNNELRTFLERNADRTDEEVLTDYETWAQSHHDSRSEMRSITEAYTPHADATMAFFIENDLEPTFDFGGHGDDDPQCPICQALASSGPHPISRVLEIGIPHLGCRQEWHPNIEPDQLPDELFLGGKTAGLLGGEPLRDRAGSQEAAVEMLSAPVDSGS
jgi:hypothetical protein